MNGNLPTKKPLNYPGFFVVFEGIDGAGTTTQAGPLTERIKRLNKYHDILDTHEPWKAPQIDKILRRDSDPNTKKEEMTRLFTDMRKDHTQNLISPSLEEGIIVVSDRYTLSTCAYQEAQGVSLQRIVDLHKTGNILIPNVTYLIDAPAEVCIGRIGHRAGEREKFEETDFLEKVRKNYLDLSVRAGRRDYGGLFGEVVLIDGGNSIPEVAKAVSSDFKYRYRDWIKDVSEYESSSGEQLAFDLWGTDSGKANSDPI